MERVISANVSIHAQPMPWEDTEKMLEEIKAHRVTPDDENRRSYITVNVGQSNLYLSYEAAEKISTLLGQLLLDWDVAEGRVPDFSVLDDDESAGVL